MAIRYPLSVQRCQPGYRADVIGIRDGTEAAQLRCPCAGNAAFFGSGNLTCQSEVGGTAYAKGILPRDRGTDSSFVPVLGYGLA